MNEQDTLAFIRSKLLLLEIYEKDVARYSKDNLARINDLREMVEDLQKKQEGK